MRLAGLFLASILLVEGYGFPVQDVSESYDAPVEVNCGSNVNAGMASIVELYFPESETCTALRIVWCESQGKATAVNPRSGASGLFQVMPFWADHYGYDRASLLDPVLNTEMAYRIWSEEGGWRHWSCW